MKRNLFIIAAIVPGLLFCSAASGAQMVFPTTPHAAQNGIPFGSGTTNQHNALDDQLWVKNLGGQPIGRITAIAFSPGYAGMHNLGPLDVNMGYTDLEPGFLDFPSSGKNQKWPLTSFFSDPAYSVNITKTGTEEWTEMILSGSFDYDLTKGNLLIEITCDPPANTLTVSRTAGSAEGSRTFDSVRFGSDKSNTTATRMQFTFTGVPEPTTALLLGFGLSLLIRRR